MRNPIKSLGSAENRLALLIAVVVVLLVILSSNDAPLWIYQGF